MAKNDCLRYSHSVICATLIALKQAIRITTNIIEA